ncbi:ferritin-like domain-containing protein [Pseudanabaenaceae cyanobacterium LEGE 13415]|nr:ferritin-like domain-containing protein [Pseudanabaenaceae cyanobacterium LEGE 13415]
MNLLTQVLHIVGSGASAYVLSSSIRDSKTRPNVLAGFQMAESGAVPFLQALRDRAASEGETWLAEKLDRHANDEKRHGQIFAHGLKQLNRKVMDFSKMRERELDGNPSEQRSPFFGTYFRGYTQEQLKPENLEWSVFMASTYILELDASNDFVRMANALPDDPTSANLKKGIMSVAQDETGHAAYLREAMERRYGARQTQLLIDEWRSRKVDAMLAAMQGFISKGGKMAQMVEEGAPVDMQAVEQVAA